MACELSHNSGSAFRVPGEKLQDERSGRAVQPCRSSQARAVGAQPPSASACHWNPQSFCRRPCCSGPGGWGGVVVGRGSSFFR